MLSVYFFFFQAEDGIRDLVRSRGLGDVYKRQLLRYVHVATKKNFCEIAHLAALAVVVALAADANACLLYTSDAADERSSVDLGGRRIIKKKNQ